MNLFNTCYEVITNLFNTCHKDKANLFEEDNILTHRFFRAMYWRTFREESKKPQVGFRSFLGTLNDLVCNKKAFGTGALDLACALDYDNDDNELRDKVFFVFSPDDWNNESAEEETAFINYPDFIKLVEEVLIEYANLQEKRWKRYPHIREAEEQEIESIKKCLYTDFGQSQ
jgi:hypothetical protein